MRIDVATLINRPVQEVWDYFFDLTNSPHWTRSGSELRQTSPGPLGVGSTVEGVRRMFGRDIRSQTMTATRYEPAHLVDYAVAVPILGHFMGGVTFEAVGGGTRLSRWTEGGLGRAEGLLGPLFSRLMRRLQRTELSNLKRLIEARPSPLA